LDKSCRPSSTLSPESMARCPQCPAKAPQASAGKITNSKLLKRIQDIGPISLLSVLVSCIMLNILAAVMVIQVRNFGVGILDEASIDSRALLTVLRIALGLFKRGVLDAFDHTFEWWCTREARNKRLDYGRLLNSFKGSPALFGYRHGHPNWMIAKTTLWSIAVGCSFVYSFLLLERMGIAAIICYGLGTVAFSLFLFRLYLGPA